MQIEFDEQKRRDTLNHRSLDFADAAQVFAGLHFTRIDDRFDYGETREITTGLLNDVCVVVVWTDRETARRIISMRKADKDEREHYFRNLDRPG